MVKIQYKYHLKISLLKCKKKFGGAPRKLAATALLRKRTHGKEYTAAVEEWCIVLSLIFLQFILGFQPCHTPSNWRSFSIRCLHSLHTLPAVINCKPELESSHSPSFQCLVDVLLLPLLSTYSLSLRSKKTQKISEDWSC